MSAARLLIITEITSTDKGRRPQAMSATPRALSDQVDTLAFAANLWLLSSVKKS
jgi:hypothetical protein